MAPAPGSAAAAAAHVAAMMPGVIQGRCWHRSTAVAPDDDDAGIARVPGKKKREERV